MRVYNTGVGLERVSTTFLMENSHNCVLCSSWGSNLGSLEFDSDALPIDPPRHIHIFKSILVPLSRNRLYEGQPKSPVISDVKRVPVNILIELRCATVVIHHVVMSQLR